MNSKQLLALAGIACGTLLSASAANAVTLSVAYSLDGGTTYTLINSGTGSASGTASAGIWSFIEGSGTGNPPLTGNALLDTSSINIASTGTGTLLLAVTEQGLTGPVKSSQGFNSSFTSNAVGDNITTNSISTYLSSTNALYTGVLLSTASFTGIGTSSGSALGDTGTGPYSLTAIYTITASGAGQINDTANITATPIPAAFPLFAGGLGVVGLLARRKKRKNVTAL